MPKEMETQDQINRKKSKKIKKIAAKLAKQEETNKTPE